MEVPVWRVVADDNGGDWTLVADGLLKPRVESASPGVVNDVPRMWNADIESLIHEEFTCSEPHQCPLKDNGRADRFSIAKENFQPKPMGLGLLAEDPEEHSKGLSPRKPGILTENSALCNGSVVPPKRQRLYEAPSIKSDVQPMFQTASSKPVQFSVSAMQKARALLGFDEVGPCATYGQEQSRPTNASFQVASKVGEVSKNASTVGDMAGNAKRQCVAARGITNKIAKGSAFPTQTAAQKPVLINLNKVETCVSTVDHASVRYGLDEESNTNMFLIAREQPNSFSRTAGEEDLCFPPNEPYLSTLAGHVDQHNAEATSCLFQTATGKAVSISESGMLRAAKLLEKTDTSNVDHNLGLNMFQTARGQPVSVSSTGVKRAAKLLGDENFPFPAEGPLFSSPIRFVTAVGKSVSVSRSAMKRAQDLLGADLENTEITTPAHLVNKGEHNCQQLFETPEGHLIKVSSGSIERARLLLKDGALNTSSGICPLPVASLDINAAKGADMQELFPRTGFKTRHSPCVQESNFTSVSKKGAMPRKSIASFKAPRRLQPVQPAASSSYCKEAPIQQVKYDFSQLVNLKSLHKKKKPKSSLKEYFRHLPHQEIEFRHLTNDIKRMTSETAKTYKFSSTIDGLESIGSDEFRLMLLEIGANSQVVTKEWVDNHYRWIVWKLASLERSYPSKVANKLLTIQTVFDELKYRYEREGGCAHRSALKRLTEGDSVAGRMMVLCVAAVCNKEPIGTNSVDECPALSGDPQTVYVEVTDGWYSLIAHLDPPLIRQLKAGKVFIGQKLRVCGATLLGCTTPLPPLEAFQVMKLALHMNGTYRAHWMDKLGLLISTFQARVCLCP